MQRNLVICVQVIGAATRLAHRWDEKSLAIVKRAAAGPRWREELALSLNAG